MTFVIGEVRERLSLAGLVLPPNPVALGMYSLAVLDGSRLYLAGHGPFATEGPAGKIHCTGRIGADLSQAEGEEAATLTALSLLSSCQAALGSLDDLRGFLALRVAVLATEGADLVAVANAASQVLAVALPDSLPPARSVFGAAELPFGIPVVIEAVVSHRRAPTSPI